MGIFGPWQNGPYLRNASKLSKWNNIRIDTNNVFSPVREEECLRRPIKKLVWTMSFVASVTCASLICSRLSSSNFLLSPPFSNPCHCSEHRTLSKTNAQKLQIHSLILLQINQDNQLWILQSYKVNKYLQVYVHNSLRLKMGVREFLSEKDSTKKTWFNADRCFDDWPRCSLEKRPSTQLRSLAWSLTSFPGHFPLEKHLETNETS